MKPPKPTRPNPNVGFPPPPGVAEKVLMAIGYLVGLAAVLAYFGSAIWVRLQ